MTGEQDDFTARLRGEIKEAARRRGADAVVPPRTQHQATMKFLEPLIREIGRLRAEVDALRHQKEKP